MDDKDIVKKFLANLDERGGLKKQPKDFKTIWLKDLSDDPTDNIKKEYRRLSKQLGQAKSNIRYLINLEGISEKRKTEGEKIIEEIKDAKKNGLELPKSRVDSTNEKYVFFPGKSEAKFDDYENVKNSVFENCLWIASDLIEDVLYDANGFIFSVKKELWSEKLSYDLNISAIGDIKIVKEKENGG